MNVPRHIAIIMDGNGRWARRRGLRRVMGHHDGATTVRAITRACRELGVKRLTLYAFSRDNWKRPRRETNYLMRLLEQFLISERQELMETNVRLTAVGRLEEMPAHVRKALRETIGISARNTGMTLCLALSYSGRTEIVDAAVALARDVLAGARGVEQIDEKVFSSYMYDTGMTEPDLLIRTGGDIRLSDFLLWHVSYTELWVTPICWPEFTREHLLDAVKDYAKRERRFGDIKTAESE